MGRTQKGKSPEKCPGPTNCRKLTPLNELFLTLVRLRCGLLNCDLAYRFGISESSVSDTITTWVQFTQFVQIIYMSELFEDAISDKQVVLQ